MIELIKKYGEIIRYIFIGICTTLVSLVSYYLLITFVFNSKNALELQITNIISWILSVSFAFVTNKIFVFKSKNQNVGLEILKFFEARILTLIIDIVSMFIMVTILNLNDKFSKLVVQFIILILNYIFSKFLVFKNNKKENL